MNNNKNMRDELCRQDGMEPGQISDNEYNRLETMFNEEDKSTRFRNWIKIAFICFLAITLLISQIMLSSLKVFNLIFSIGWLLLLLLSYVFFVSRWIYTIKAKIRLKKLKRKKTEKLVEISFVDSADKPFWLLAVLRTRTVKVTMATLSLIFIIYSGYVVKHEPNPQNTVIIGQSSLFSDSFAGFRILVRNHSTGNPVEKASVSLFMEGRDGTKKLGEFVTGKDGSFSEPVYIPPVPPGKYSLVVESKSKIGFDRIVQQVNIQRPYRLYVTTDKPLYQPGQTIHIRSIVLNRVSLKPFTKEPVIFEIEDPKGNKVFKETLLTSDYGIATADFDLADQINLGRYTVRVIAGQVESEKIVTVKHYVLPKFKADISTDKTYYLPSQRISGKVKADYFFGKPVANARIELIGQTIIEKPTEIFRITGKADQSGEYLFDLDLPDYFAGMPLAGGNAFLQIEATVTDTAGHNETVTKHLAVAEQAINIHVMPESGDSVSGVENIVYILTAYPDGQPAECQLVINGSNLSTDISGIAAFKTIPETDGLKLNIKATDKSGNSAVLSRKIDSVSSQNFLLRTDKAVYSGGDTIAATVLSATNGTFFIDVIKDAQTVLTKTLEVENGRSMLQLDLSPALFGTLKLNAYTITADGQSRADSRIVHVNKVDDLRIDTSLDNDIYKPGETATVRFQVTNSLGKPTPAALSIAAVDEAVFFLSENRPGLLEQFFLADKELLKPAYQTKFAVSPSKLLSGNDGQQKLALALFSTPVERTPGPDLKQLSEFLEPEDIERFQRNAKEGKYDELLQDPEYAGFADLLKPQEDYTLRATTYHEKAAKTKAFRDRYFEIVTASVIVILVTGIVLTLVILFFRSTLKIIRQSRINDMDPEAATICQAVNNFLESYGVLFLLPFVTYIPMMIFCEISEISHISRDINLWCTLAVNAVMVIILSMKQFQWTQDLARFEKTRRLAARLGVLPAVFIVQYIVSRMIVVAAIYGLLDEEYGFMAVLASFIMLGIIAAAAALMVKKTAPRYRIKRKRSIFIEVAVVIAIIAFLLSIMMPALGTAKYMSADIVLRSDFKQLVMAGELAEEEGGIINDGAIAGKPVLRIRKYFPETLLWQPELITDDTGKAVFDIITADSITTWRMNVDAVSASGELGSSELGIRVFQDFFVDLDLPTALTRNDEISIPVLCYNYLPQPQTVQLSLDAGDWCQIQGPSEHQVILKANEVRSVMFRIKATEVGTQQLTITASGEQLSDAVERQIKVLPDGTEVHDLKSDTLSTSVEHTFYVPEHAIPSSQKMLLKMYPSTFSEVVEGLDSIFQKPYGCFEQTSSTTYPNVMALMYMKRTNQITPEIEIKARKYITAGYQRLLTFEVDGGGFDWFGSPPANELLTAYGVLEFTDMSKVHNIDQEVINRSIQWLLSKQQSNGSWKAEKGAHTWNAVQDELMTTAYISWALTEAGQSNSQINSALSYLRQNIGSTDDPYTIALAANVILASDSHDAFGKELITHLQSKFNEKDESAYIRSTGVGAMYSRGKCLDIETTALSALAMMKDNRYPDMVKKALTWISQQKDQSGTWHSTQATILAMKALVAGTGEALGSNQPSNIEVTVNNRIAGKIKISPDSADLLHVLDLTEFLNSGSNNIRLSKDSSTGIPYQLVGTYWVQEEIVNVQSEKELQISVDYDKARLEVNDTLTCTVEVKAHTPDPINMAIIDLGIPPGFKVDPSTFKRLVDNDVLAKYDLTGNQCILYVRVIRPDKPLLFSYDLTALYPIRAKVPLSRVYEYYKPENKDRTQLREVMVSF